MDVDAMDEAMDVLLFWRGNVLVSDIRITAYPK